MVLFDEVEIDGDSIRLTSCGRVVATTGAVVPFEVVDPDGRPVEPIWVRQAHVMAASGG